MPTTLKVWIAAFFIIIVFLVAADHLYALNYSVKSDARSAFLLKVADSLINGAIVGVLLAMLRWWLEIPKVVAALNRLFPTPDPKPSNPSNLPQPGAGAA